LFECAPDPILVVSIGGIVLEANTAACQLLAVRHQGLLGRNVLELAPSNFRRQLDDDFARLVSNELGQTESLFQSADGGTVSVELRVSQIEWMNHPALLIHARDITERKRCEERLRSNIIHYCNLVETSSDLIWSVDEEGRFTFVNRQAARNLLGYSPEEMLGKRFTDFQTPEQAARDWEVHCKLKNGDVVARHESSLLHKDGRLIHIIANAVVQQDDHGRILVTGNSTDITERRKAEERYRLLFERNLAGVFRSTLEGRLLSCNDSFARILGYEAQSEILQFHAWDLFYRADDRAQLLRQLKERGALTSYEVCYRRRDNAPVWVLENVGLVRDGDGQSILEGTIVDITERKWAEEALRASEAKYRTLIENLDQNIILKNDQLQFIAVNRHYCRSVGLTESQLLGKCDFDVYPPDLAAKYRADDLVVLNEGRTLQVEERCLIGDRARNVRVVKTPVRNDLGVVVGVLVIFWDVTEQLDLEMQLRHAQKMDAIGQLAGGVAHDFNNLLTVILGNIALALREPAPLGQTRSLLQDAEQAALRAADLTKRLLGFSRRSHLHVRPVDLRQSVDEAVRFLRRTIDPRIKIEVSAAADLWPALADPGQLNQVLINLAVNARDAMPRGGLLHIDVSNFVPSLDYLHRQLEARPGEFLRLSVRDTGTGIPPHILQRIFEPFFTTKDIGKGTGLGLATVFGIIKQHQGWIECHSEIGAGTRFDCYLPRCSESAIAAERKPTANTKGTETILLVDDEAMLRNLGRLILEGQGYSVLLANDGLEALSIYRQYQQRIKLVILDGAMPHMSGQDAFAELRLINDEVRVLFSSGFSAEDYHLEEYPQFAGFIDKPYRVEQLAAKVRQVLDDIRT